jgi:hypothetical protein
MVCMSLRLVPRLLLCLPLVAGFGSVAAQAGDPLNTAECRAARTRLDVATAAVTGRSEASARALQAARERVAMVCLGRPGEVVRELPDGSGVRAPYPAVRVPPVGGAAAATPVLPSRPQVPPAPLAVPRAAVITQCDPTGCWDSSGRRLNRVGPGLAGPGGPCTVQGNSAMCP